MVVTFWAPCSPLLEFVESRPLLPDVEPELELAPDVDPVLELEPEPLALAFEVSRPELEPELH